MSKYSEHDKDKIFFEYLVKGMLQNYKLIDDDFQKGEGPDFQNGNTGLEIARADETLVFDGYILKYGKDGIKNIKKFNKGFKECRGRVFEKSDPVVKILDLRDTFGYNENYVYIAPSYRNSFDPVNKEIMAKLEKLNSEYADLEHYFLGIFSPVFVSKDGLEDELKKIEDMQSNYNKKFEKILIVFVDKICTFDLTDSTYDVLEDTNEKLNEISIKAAGEAEQLCRSA